MISHCTAKSYCYAKPPFNLWAWIYCCDFLALGWQYQKSPPTIQCLIEQALTQVTKLERKDLCVVGASRTDAGVHAWGQVRLLVH